MKTVTAKRDKHLSAEFKAHMGKGHVAKRDDDKRLARERRIRAWIENFATEDLKTDEVTTGEWTLLQIAAENVVELEAMTSSKRLAERGRQMSAMVTKIVNSLRRGRGAR